MKIRFLLFSLFLFVCCNVFAAEKKEFLGITEPFKDSVLSSTVSGALSIIKSKEGTLVKEGDIILELENMQESLEVQRRKIIAESKIEVNSAKDKAETLKQDFESTKQIFESTESVSKDELDKKELEYKIAKAEYEKLLIDEKKEDLEYQIAQSNLEKRYVRAPFDGEVVKVHLQIGENCDPQQPLVRVVDTSKCRFITYVEASLTRQLSKDMQVSIYVEDETEPIVCQGNIEYISPVVDPASGLQEVKVVFDNTEYKISPGVNAIMRLE